MTGVDLERELAAAKRFVRVPHAAKRLTPLQRDVLFGLLGYCRHAPFCWPGQRRLARDLRRSLGMVNQGIRELVVLGAVSRRVQPGRQTCIYEIAVEFWIPRKRSNPADTVGLSLRTCSAGRTESEPTFKKKTPPVGPPQAGGDALFVDEPVQVDGAETEATPPAEGRQNCSPASETPIAPAAEIISPGELGSRSYRNRKPRRPRPPRVNSRRRDRNRPSPAETLRNAFRKVADERAALRTGIVPPPALPPPQVEILTPDDRSLAARYDSPAGKLMVGFLRAAAKRSVAAAAAVRSDLIGMGAA